MGRVSVGNESPPRAGAMDMNMVFTIPTEFRALEHEVVEMALGVERAMFEKPEKASQHVKPLLIRGHLDSKPLGRMMVDGGANINIMPWTVFKGLGHTRLILSRLTCGFSGETTMAQGIISKELTIGSKTTSNAFFIADVKECYNVLLAHNWIHTSECMPSTLHQCLVQWVGNQVEKVIADDEACIAFADAQIDMQGGQMRCLSGRDLMEYDYVSVGKDGFVPISMKPMTSATRLADDIVGNVEKN
jgi:hypothetical protein